MWVDGKEKSNRGCYFRRQTRTSYDHRLRGRRQTDFVARLHQLATAAAVVAGFRRETCPTLSPRDQLNRNRFIVAALYIQYYKRGNPERN